MALIHHIPVESESKQLNDLLPEVLLERRVVMSAEGDQLWFALQGPQRRPVRFEDEEGEEGEGEPHEEERGYKRP